MPYHSTRCGRPPLKWPYCCTNPLDTPLRTPLLCPTPSAYQSTSASISLFRLPSEKLMKQLKHVSCRLLSLARVLCHESRVTSHESRLTTHVSRVLCLRFVASLTWDSHVVNAQRRRAWGVQGGRGQPQPSALRAGVSGVACPQGIEEWGKAGPSDTLGSPWAFPAIRPCRHLLGSAQIVDC
jgi:hypothetical protein